MTHALSAKTLDNRLVALADPKRHAMLRRLARGEARATGLGAPFDVSLNVVSKHIKLLVGAGLVQRRRVGREHLLWFRLQRLSRVQQWITKQELSCGPREMIRNASALIRFVAICALMLPAAGFAQGDGTVSIPPFTNISGDPGEAWIGAGIAETLIVDLQGAPGFQVVLGEQVGASRVVSGAYQRIGNRIRITARLVDVASGAVIRSAVVDGAMHELFDLQDRLAVNLAGGPETPASQLAAPQPPAAAGSGSATGRGGGAGTLPMIDGAPPPVAPDVISRDERGRTTIRAVRLDDGLIVDGALDEAVYATVPSFGGFIQTEPTAGAPATERTEAWVFFDDTNLYITARLWDEAPEAEWVVNEMRRDSNNLSQNEGVAILLDTFYDRRNGNFFTISPIGGRADGQVSNERGYNRDWNPVWAVETGRFAGGWTFEAAFPFKSMRYRPGQSQVWGLQLRRRVRHKNETSFLTALDPGLGQTAIFQVSRSATLVGLEAPESGRPIEIKPYVIGNLSSDLNASPAISHQFAGDVGLDLKYGVTENLTTDVTFNTDFAQVEADEQQVNLTRFNLFFPEKREFFLENQGTFSFGGSSGRAGDTPVMFHSRRIGLNEGREVPIVAGGRLTGRVGRFSLGLINIQTDDEPVGGALTTNFTVARVKRDLLRRSSIGAIVTHRSALASSPGASQTYGADAAFAFYENVAITTYWATTRTTGREGQDTSYNAAFRYNGDRYGATAEHLLVDAQFAPAIGFVRRDDFRKSRGSVRFSPRPRAIEAVRKFTWEGSYTYITDAAGLVETREAEGRFETEFESSDTVEVSYTTTYDFLKTGFLIAPDITVPVGGYDFWNARAAFRLGQQRPVSGLLFAEHGSFYDGTKTTLGLGGGSFGGRIELTPQFSFEPGLSFNWIDLPQGSFLTRLVTTRATYTISPAMFASALLQYNSSNNGLSANVRFRWEYQPGSELFVVYTEHRDTLTPRAFPQLENRAFIVKFNRLLRF
jgi:TolB-like protein/DNA-binding transcriptional ArsR family regulator